MLRGRESLRNLSDAEVEVDARSSTAPLLSGRQQFAKEQFLLELLGIFDQRL
jgi:hypothetical protein